MHGSVLSGYYMSWFRDGILQFSAPTSKLEAHSSLSLLLQWNGEDNWSKGKDHELRTIFLETANKNIMRALLPLHPSLSDLI